MANTIKIGNIEASSIKIGTSTVSAVYIGSIQVYPATTPPTPSYDIQYFTTESTSDDNTISFTMGTGLTTAITTAVTSVSVSTDDGVTWTSMENIGANASLSVTLNAGEKAIWKGEAIGYSTATASTRSTVFSSTGRYKVYGNITSLLYDNNFKNIDNPTLPDFNCFTNLFYDSTGLTDASNLIMHFELPATTSKRQLSYLFQGCTSLVNAPELKNIGFGGSQYTFRNMFRGCTSLTTAPELTATTLTQGCYAYMFYGCTSLTTAPELPAATLVKNCYQQMFYGCTSLNYIKCLATDISANSSRANWVNNVSSSGTFVKAASMNGWTTGTAGIPEGWVVENEGDTPSTKQWVSYTAGTSISEITDNVYGIRIALDNLHELFAGGGTILDISLIGTNNELLDIVIDIGNIMAYITDGTDETPIEYDFESDLEIVFSDYGFNGDYEIIDMLLDGSQDGTLLCDMQLYM